MIKLVALCIVGIFGLILAASIVLSLIPVYLPTHGDNANVEFSDERFIVYNLPESIQFNNGLLTDVELNNFQTAMQQRLTSDDKTLGSLIFLKSGIVFTGSLQRERRSQMLTISEEGQSSTSTTKHCKISYVLKFPRKSLLPVQRMQLLLYISQTVLTKIELLSSDLYSSTSPTSSTTSITVDTSKVSTTLTDATATTPTVTTGTTPAVTTATTPAITTATTPAVTTVTTPAVTTATATIPNSSITNPFINKLSPATVNLASPNDEYTFNEANMPITIQLTPAILDTSNYVLFSNNIDNLAFSKNITPIMNTTSTTSSITIPAGFPPGHTLITLIGLDSTGLPIFLSFSLYFGIISMPVTVYYENGTAAANVPVQVNLTDFTRVGQTVVTNSSGIAVFTNVPPVTVSIFVHTVDNQIGLGGLQPTPNGLTVNLIPLNSSLSKRRRRREDAGAPFSVFTNYVEALQTQSVSFMSQQNATEVYAEYQFITSEVPGGYFGTQFNDYFSVTLRSDTGGYQTITQSMNSLGLGAFDYTTGAASKTNLTLSVGQQPELIQIDIAVSNVADAALQSRLTVDRYGSDVCDECEQNCDKCTSDPMCAPSCINPPLKSCDFYLNCLEKKAPCGADGYAFSYGLVYCTKFTQNINLFSSEGETWIYNTMNCLQKALVAPLQNCVKDCSILQDLAFSSHPSCYVNNGVCELPALDYLIILPIVGPGLLSKAGIIQALITAPQCIPSIVVRILAVEEHIPDFLTRQALLFLRKWLLTLNS